MCVGGRGPPLCASRSGAPASSTSPAGSKRAASRSSLGSTGKGCRCSGCSLPCCYIPSCSLQPALAKQTGNLPALPCRDTPSVPWGLIQGVEGSCTPSFIPFLLLCGAGAEWEGVCPRECLGLSPRGRFRLTNNPACVGFLRAESCPTVRAPTLQAMSPAWHECPRAHQGHVELRPQPGHAGALLVGSMLGGKACEKGHLHSALQR